MKSSVKGRRSAALLVVLGVIATVGFAASPVAGADTVRPDPVAPPVTAPHDHADHDHEPAVAEDHDPADHDHGDVGRRKALTKVPPNDRSRGLVYDGLTIGEAGTPCAGGFVVATGAAAACTHGPDPAPPGVNLLAGPEPLPLAAAPEPLVRPRTCIGDGTSGPRVEILYVRATGSADNSAASIPQLKAWADDIDEMVLLSALETGGQRRVRWLTDSSCVPVVRALTVQADHLDFSAMRTELAGRGLTSPDRKYLVWLDANPGYCGLGEQYPDSSPSQQNDNNAPPRAMFASISRSCWFADIGAHEVMHTFGAVQADAPNATAYGHCEDDADIMCYPDGPGTVIRQVCPSTHEDRLDCNHDDYFHTAPAPSNYLATHWNTANSRFFDATGVADPPSAPGPATAAAGNQSATVTWTAPGYDGGQPVIGYNVTASPGGASMAATSDARALTFSGLANGTAYVFSVVAVNRIGPSSPSTTPPVTPSPVITTIAGTGTSSSTGDGGPATLATLREARDVAVDSVGNRYVATADSVRRITPAGVISTVVGSPSPTSAADGTPPLQIAVNAAAVAIGPGDVLYWSDVLRHTVRKLQGGVVTTVAGTAGTSGFAGDGSAATSALLANPSGIAVTSTGDVYVADWGNSRIRRISGGIISTVAGSDVVGGFGGDGGPATAARLNGPMGVTVAADGTLYIADQRNNRVRRVSAGVITTVAGNGTTGGSSSTVPTAASLPFVSEVVLTTGGFLVVAQGNCAVHRVTDGVLTTIAGTTVCGFAGDGGPAPAARIQGGGLALDASGRLLIADGINNRVRLVTSLAPTPAAVAPGAPLSVTATPGYSKVTVSWMPPSNGGSPLLDNRITVQPGGAVIDVAAGVTSTVVSGLTPGSSYRFYVQARNAVGRGPSKMSGLAVPSRSPTAPTAVSATAGDARALVVWARPTAGSSPITGYVITSSPGGVSALAPAGATRIVVPALSTTTSYRFTVAAVDVNGIGPASALSNAVTPSPKAPFLSTDAFIRQVFLDFIARSPSAAELADFRNYVDTGMASRADVVELLMSQPYWSNAYAPVGRLYFAYFRRLPDKGGLDYWVGLFRRGMTLGDISSNFASSAEFRSTYGSLGNDAFVRLVYSNVLGRAPDAGGLAYWSDLINRGYPRGQLMTNFSESAEYLQKMANEVTVVMLWRGMLSAIPSQARYDDAVARLDAGASIDEIIDEILLDPAYAARITR